MEMSSKKLNRTIQNDKKKAKKKKAKEEKQRNGMRKRK